MTREDQLDHALAMICERLRKGEKVDLDREEAALSESFHDVPILGDAIECLHGVAAEFDGA